MKTYVWILFALVVILIVSNLLNKQNDINTTCDTGDCDDNIDDCNTRTQNNPRLNTTTIGACDPTTKTCKLPSTQKNKQANSSRSPPADFNETSTKESGVFSPVYDTNAETKARPDNLEVY